MDKKVELIYLSMRGKAELSRLILAAAGTDYVDVRITGKEYNKRKKRNKDYGLPLLRWDSQGVSEERSGMFPVARFLAERLHMNGDSDIQKQMVETLDDYVGKYYEQLAAIFEATCNEDREQLIDYFLEEFLPQFLDTLERMLDDSDGAFAAGQTATYVDLAVMDLVLRLQDPNDLLYQGLDRCDARFVTLPHFPRVLELVQRTAALPGVAEWLVERPPQAKLLIATTEVLSQWEVTYAGDIAQSEG